MEPTEAHMARSTPAIVVIDVVALFIVAPMLFSPAMGADKAVPDLAGSWARATFAIEPPASGPGPLRNLARPGDEKADADPGAIRHINTMLKPEAAELVKKRFEATRAGKPPPTPLCSRSHHETPTIYL